MALMVRSRPLSRYDARIPLTVLMRDCSDVCACYVKRNWIRVHKWQSIVSTYSLVASFPVCSSELLMRSLTTSSKWYFSSTHLYLCYLCGAASTLDSTLQLRADLLPNRWLLGVRG